MRIHGLLILTSLLVLMPLSAFPVFRSAESPPVSGGHNEADGGTLILSGLLGTQEDAVCDAYAQQGMGLIKRYIRGEWHSLMLRKRM